MRRRVAISILGTTLDAGRGERWKRWRPTVALCQQQGLFIDRLELLHGDNSINLAREIISDIETVLSEQTKKSRKAPDPSIPQAAQSSRHSARAAVRRSLNVCLLTRVRSELK